MRELKTKARRLIAKAKRRERPVRESRWWNVGLAHGGFNYLGNPIYVDAVTHKPVLFAADREAMDALLPAIDKLRDTPDDLTGAEVEALAEFVRRFEPVPDEWRPSEVSGADEEPPATAPPSPR